MKDSIKKLLLAFAVIAVTAVFAELVLGLFLPQSTFDRAKKRFLSVTAPSDVLPFSLRPHAEDRLYRSEFDTIVRVNSLGYRSAEFDPEKGDKYRILALGDSFTFGYGVENEEAYPALLQNRLREACPEGNIEVINAGFASGQYADTYYLYLREFGLELDPDLVTVGFFIGNDIDHDLVWENVWTEVNEEGLPDKIEHPHLRFDGNYRIPKKLPLRYRYPMIRNSHLAQGIVTIVRSSRRREPRVYYNHWMYRPEYEDRTKQQVEVVQRLFLAMHELTEARGIDFRVVMIPTREQIVPDQFPFEDEPYQGNVDLEKPQRLFSEFFTENGIEFIDLLPALRAAANRDELYFPVDQHLTTKGHALLSRIVVESLGSAADWKHRCRSGGRSTAAAAAHATDSSEKFPGRAEQTTARQHVE